MAELDDQVIKLVEQIRNALAIVRENSKKKLEIALQSAELNLKLTEENKQKAGGDFVSAWVPIKVGMERSTSSVAEFSLTLIPALSNIDLGQTESQKLADNIFVLASAMASAQRASQPQFNLKDASITIGLEITQAAELQVLIGGSSKDAAAHTIKLEFRPN
jgi:hypothetical protein